MRELQVKAQIVTTNEIRRFCITEEKEFCQFSCFLEHLQSLLRLPKVSNLKYKFIVFYLDDQKDWIFLPCNRGNAEWSEAVQIASTLNQLTLHIRIVAEPVVEVLSPTSPAVPFAQHFCKSQEPYVFLPSESTTPHMYIKI